MCKTPPLLMGRGEVVFNIWGVMHCSWSGYDSPLANGQERSCLQHLESCTGVWMGNTLPPCYSAGEKWFAISGVMQWSFIGEDSPLAMVRREAFYNIWSHALEVKILVGKTPPFLMGRREVVCNKWCHTMKFVWVGFPFPYSQERSGLEHLELCTGVWVGKTYPPLLLGRREVVCSIWSRGLEYGG